jgi:hypothetical protein
MNYTNLKQLHKISLKWIPDTDSMAVFYSSDQGLVKCFDVEGQMYWTEPGDVVRITLENGKVYTLEFTVFEAEDYGFQIPCGFKKNISGYKGLSCDPKNLQKLEEIEGIYAAGYEDSKIIYQCKSCRQKWLVHREFDSQSINMRYCTAMNE